MSKADRSMALSDSSAQLNPQQKMGSALGMAGLIILILAICNVNFPDKTLWLSLSIGSIFAGITWFSYASYAHEPAGIHNDGVWFKSMSSRGILGWLAGIGLTAFYILLYFYPAYLGLNSETNNSGIIALFDPLSNFLNGSPADQWFVYGTLYTTAILGFGIKFLWKYRHSTYQIVRTCSVMFFQLGFAFLIPQILKSLNKPAFAANTIWPLNYDLFAGYKLDAFFSAGNLGVIMLSFGILSIFVITPILTYKYGKRWYCSWVCGCGGLAETAGDPYRHLSDTSDKAWKVERWVIHSVLVFVTVMTIALVYSYLGDNADQFWLTKDVFLYSSAGFLTLLFAVIMIFKRHELAKDAKLGAIGYLVVILSIIGIHFFSGGQDVFLFPAHKLRETYGFLIGSVFSGVVGVGFYPIFGNRVWCRFGCPMAAILGMQQRLFSKFRITTNGGQCISCGNCSAYCEMGIDVREYAQKGMNIVRSSCVGCGVCAEVCPRGVLKLENDSPHGRINPKDVLLGNDVDLMDYVNQKR